MEAAQELQLETALARCANGDSSAFGEIIQAHQKMVFSIAYHFLRSRPLAEELAQDVFLELYRGLGNIESPAHLVYWLRRVTVNRCIDHGRRRKPELGLDEVPEPSVEDRSRDHFLADMLQRSISELPERQRIIVVLRYQEDMAPAEIADVVNLPLNTVKSNLHRALAALRKKLRPQAGELHHALF